MNPDAVVLELPGEPGGRKTFWAHLDDLRTALLRSMIALGIALILCLTFVDRLVPILEYPLRHIDLFEKPKATVSFQIGDTRLGPYVVTKDQFAGLPPGTAPHAIFQMDSV